MPVNRGPLPIPAVLRALSRASCWRPASNGRAGAAAFTPLAAGAGPKKVRADTSSRRAHRAGAPLPRARLCPVATGPFWSTTLPSGRRPLLFSGHGGAERSGRRAQSRARLAAAGVWAAGPSQGASARRRARPAPGPARACGWRWGQSAARGGEATSVVLIVWARTVGAGGASARIDGNIRQSITTDLPAVRASLFLRATSSPAKIDGLSASGWRPTPRRQAARRQRADGCAHQSTASTAARPWRPQAGTWVVQGDRGVT